MDRIGNIKALLQRLMSGESSVSRAEIEASLAELKTLESDFIAALDQTKPGSGDREAELQKALQKSKERWQLALEGSGDGLWDWDIPSNQVYYSPRWEAMFGLPVGSVEQTFDTFQRHVHPDDIAGMQAHVQRYLSRQLESYSREFRMYHADGSLMWTLHRGAAVFDDSGNPIRMIGTTANITARKKAEEELIRTHELLIRTNAAARIGWWELDLIGGNLFWSEGTKEIYEVDPDFVPDLETGINFYKEGRSRELITEVVNRAISDGTPYDVELQIITATDREVWVRSIGEAEFKDGRCVRLFGTFQDIDSRKQAESELIRTREQAVVANNAKTEFLAHMSHELRTPLNAILGFAQILAADSISPEQANHLRTIQSSGEHLLTLIEDILDMAKIESGQLAINNHDFSLGLLLKDVAAIIQLRTAQTGVEFGFEPPRLPDLLNGDSRKLRQVLLNLLSNAVKFTIKGRIEMKVEHVARGWKFTVSDTGIGIDPDEASQLFQPFQRLARDLATPGSGLGLAISQKIVAAMGGKIEFESQPGQGSRFWFTIPIRPVDRSLPGERRDRIRPIGYHGTRRKILVVDDDPDNRRLLETFLSPLGFEIHLATDGREAIEKALTLWPHLILLDLMMPVMDGFATCEKLRLTIQGKQARILVLSADAYADTRERILATGADGFLAKPIRFQDLIDNTADMLDLEWVYPTP